MVCERGKESDRLKCRYRLEINRNLPLHAKWLVELYTKFTSFEERRVIIDGWKKAGRLGIISGATILPNDEPFI